MNRSERGSLPAHLDAGPTNGPGRRARRIHRLLQSMENSEAAQGSKAVGRSTLVLWVSLARGSGVYLQVSNGFMVAREGAAETLSCMTKSQPSPCPQEAHSTKKRGKTQICQLLSFVAIQGVVNENYTGKAFEHHDDERGLWS